MIKQKTINFIDELEDAFQRLNLSKEDVCLTGSCVLKILKLRDNNDIDCIVKSDVREKISSKCSAFNLSHNIEVVGKNWADSIKIADEEIIENKKYHFLFNDFKVVKPEILFSVKQSFNREKDFNDICLLEQYALSSDDWDWNLVSLPSTFTEVYYSQIQAQSGYIAQKINVIKQNISLIKNFFKSIVKKLIYPYKTYRNLLGKIDSLTQKYKFQADTAYLLQKSDLKIKYSTSKIFAQQYHNDKYNRMDLIVRYLAIEDYFKKNDYGFNLYNKMQKTRIPGGISKHGNIVSENNFKQLISSFINNGFNCNNKIELDSQLRLDDGAHRLALSAYMEITDVPIKIIPNKQDVVYGIKWFENNQFTQNEIKLIENKKSEIFKKLGLLFPIILWPPIQDYFEEIENDLKSNFHVHEAKTIQLGDRFSNFVRQVYAIDDIDLWKIEKKISAMSSHSSTIRFFLIEIPNPNFRKKALNNNDISMTIEKTKLNYRQKYASKINNYFHDIIIHACDNYSQNRQTIRVIDSID